MSTESIVTLIVLGSAVLAGIVGIIVALCRGEIKKYVIEMMEKAEEIYKDLPKPEKSVKKLQFVIEQVKEKYKLADLVLNIKKFVEYIISISKVNK